jgi:hypothetical protein
MVVRNLTDMPKLYNARGENKYYILLLTMDLGSWAHLIFLSQ